jgi:hypothetical protein
VLAERFARLSPHRQILFGSVADYASRPSPHDDLQQG